MKLLWLPDPLMRVLYEDDGLIAVDKPYGLASHTNDAKEGNEDYLIPGAIELFERQLGQKLFIVHRLDQTTTGVLVIAKTPESAKVYQDFFRHRETKKTYVFATASRGSRERFDTSSPIRHKGDELEARTQFERLKKSAKFELWQARPFTGRNHQIRIHGAEVGLPLLGDVKYGGTKFPFLTLHNRRIEFPNGVTIESQLPRYLEDLARLETLEGAAFEFELDRRQRLFPDAGAIRLINRPGRTLDRLGEVDVEARTEARTEASPTAGAHSIVHSLKPKQTILNDVPEHWQVTEGGISFEMRRDASAPTHGLALEHRLARHWLRGEAASLSILSLFSSTGGFALAALAGGAYRVTAVDTSKVALNWCRRNLDLNQMSLEKIQLLCREALAYLSQCRAKNNKFDFVIADPPNFARTESGVFRIEEKYRDLIAGSLDVLTPRGRLLFATASESLSFDDVKQAILKVDRGAEIAVVQPPLDFELPGERSRLKTFLVRRS